MWSRRERWIDWERWNRKKRKAEQKREWTKERG